MRIIQMSQFKKKFKINTCHNENLKLDLNSGMQKADSSYSNVALIDIRM